MSKRKEPLKWFDKYKVDVPVGKSGAWAVERFTISKRDAEFHGLRMLFNGQGSRAVQPGRYTRLVRDRAVIMSDTRAELRDHLSFMERAEGRVLVCGLGLGVVTRGCLMNKATHVTVIEQSADVIKLVGPWLEKQFPKRIEIINADAYTWKPPSDARWTCAWHDIWDTICTDNLPLMTKLHRKFARRVEWQDSWCRSMLKRMQRQDRRESWWRRSA